jgi:hypothetical protein
MPNHPPNVLLECSLISNASLVILSIFPFRTLVLWSKSCESGLALSFLTSHSSDWPDFLKLLNISNKFLSHPPLQYPCEPRSVTLKMVAVCSTKTLEYTSTVQYRDPNEDHQLINNNHEDMETYKTYLYTHLSKELGI